MGTVLLLATEASTEGGFGLNFDILETNLINLSIVIGLLFYFGRGFLGNILGERRSAIEEAIKDAETRQKDAAAALAEQQQKLTQAQAEAERIRSAAEANAIVAKEAILAQAAQEVERMKATAGQELEAERERAIAQLRSTVVSLALAKVEGELKTRLDDNAQNHLIDRSIALLGG
ncbi:MAG: F0F1 ATP synthase subunit B [Microcoleus sp. PH2017_29_MFU_D_A]|jgi:F-type H+-transporting ATPase subunit b|uniref:F0F1 ATP synthase subunit B n=1 Tax=unclassified Microcoleus TaxID=2642155 RepID=UPI001D9C0001|nr:MULTISPECIES: F0F1 ATP synthase subunit B [unclassified Microcoleus]MCC3430399.1 F0F1 ATP synthase subunit B [Microcoleus sp. PH2017_04_SCI_O_A]MCC3441264.1 F0F1 ATP synthase subunit B [Microcoleus sp. PH2017_03_ELD_O_A]MCC3466914.1 F0F1 ATP synthase subunit B [Microcoleus sp. PH2017_06_SFM_O_A]MCC3502566.1 F0F1 ATP synthase subunit B [Microcoleus sp. PH2017_19_SFW_U_A]TAE12471.1 MAG: F0F1 ATP synthase subunit B [Oscillatoriales cyanobacterium]